MLIVRESSNGYERYDRETAMWRPITKEEIDSVLFSKDQVDTWVDGKGVQHTALRSSAVVYYRPDAIGLADQLRKETARV